MTDKSGRVAILADTSLQRHVLQQAVLGNGYQVVLNSDPERLDEQALAMLSQAARVTALPEGLKARDFRIVLPVQFSLDSDQ